MSAKDKISQIPVVTSGGKYRTDAGFNAIKDGIKTKGAVATGPVTGKEGDVLPKPSWLRARVPGGSGYNKTRNNVREHRLATVCEESKCPNIGECWNAAVCTRACRFCSVDTGNPNGWLDPEEPENTARSVELMDLNYVVITSVDRDDLADGGAGHYAACIRAIKSLRPQTAVEALTPDFDGRTELVELVVDSGLEVFAQNVETVERLTHPVRDPRAGYQQTINVLKHSKSYRPDVLTKTSLMLGLGETEAEIQTTMDDLRGANVDILTMGQYLRPTVNHLPVQRYVSPEEFSRYRQWGLERGFLEVVSGPLVRSSYRAERVLELNNVGLEVG